MSVGYCYLTSFTYPQMKMMTMAVSISRIFTFLLTFCVILKDGFGLPISDQPGTPAQIRTQSVEPHHVRTKRCSCNSWLDTECIYFCHLDIIWVNTPSNILPYGLGSPLSRRRRSTDRCECVHPKDPTCSDFCLHRSKDPKMGSLEENDSPSKIKLLASLRSVVKFNVASVQHAVSSRKTHLTDSRLDKSDWR